MTAIYNWLTFEHVVLLLLLNTLFYVVGAYRALLDGFDRLAKWAKARDPNGFKALRSNAIGWALFAAITVLPGPCEIWFNLCESVEPTFPQWFGFLAAAISGAYAVKAWDKRPSKQVVRQF